MGFAQIGHRCWEPLPRPGWRMQADHVGKDRCVLISAADLIRIPNSGDRFLVAQVVRLRRCQRRSAGVRHLEKNGGADDYPRNTPPSFKTREVDLWEVMAKRK